MPYLSSHSSAPVILPPSRWALSITANIAKNVPAELIRLFNLLIIIDKKEQNVLVAGLPPSLFLFSGQTILFVGPAVPIAIGAKFRIGSDAPAGFSEQ